MRPRDELERFLFFLVSFAQMGKFPKMPPKEIAQKEEKEAGI